MRHPIAGKCPVTCKTGRRAVNMTSNELPVLRPTAPTAGLEEPIAALTAPRTSTAQGTAQRHRRLGRTYRRARRWVRRTPTGEMTMVMVSVGTALIFIAGIVALATK